MPRIFENLTDDNEIKNAIADYIEKVTGLKVFFSGTDHKRVFPYVVITPLFYKTAEGQAWRKQTLVDGAINTNFEQPETVKCDIDIFTEKLDIRGRLILKDPVFFGRKLKQAKYFQNLILDLNQKGIKITTVAENITSIDYKEDDKWLKRGSYEIEFSYLDKFRIIDSDIITSVEIPTPIID